MGGRTETLSHTAVTSQIASFGQRDAKVVMLSAKRVSQEIRERFNFSAVINLNNLKKPYSLALEGHVHVAWPYV